MKGFPKIGSPVKQEISYKLPVRKEKEFTTDFSGGGDISSSGVFGSGTVTGTYKPENTGITIVGSGGADTFIPFQTPKNIISKDEKKVLNPDSGLNITPRFNIGFEKKWKSGSSIGFGGGYSPGGGAHGNIKLVKTFGKKNK